MKPTEDELIEYIKPILKAEGFKKKGKRWTKITEHFTYIFFIQGSCYDKDTYYVRPGIVVNDIPADEFCSYGHMFIDIPITTKEEILSSAMACFAEWTDLDYLVKAVREFAEWEKRNPIEKRRANKVNYKKDHVPAEVLFTMSAKTKEKILKLQNG